MVIATPHNTHAELAVRALEAGRHCVVDKVMAITTEQADAMIAARDRSGRVLSVFHNRRWDWDFVTIKEMLGQGLIGRPLLIESSVCRHSMPRSLARSRSIRRVRSSTTGERTWSIRHFSSAWVRAAGWRPGCWRAPGRASTAGAMGESSWSSTGCSSRPRPAASAGLTGPGGGSWEPKVGSSKYGVDPQEDALRGGDIDKAVEPESHQGILRVASDSGAIVESRSPSIRAHWDSYYSNIANHLLHNEPLAVTAEQAREVVRVLEAAVLSSRDHVFIEGPWGA